MRTQVVKPQPTTRPPVYPAPPPPDGGGDGGGRTPGSFLGLLQVLAVLLLISLPFVALYLVLRVLGRVLDRRDARRHAAEREAASERSRAVAAGYNLLMTAIRDEMRGRFPGLSDKGVADLVRALKRQGSLEVPPDLTDQTFDRAGVCLDVSRISPDAEDLVTVTISYGGIPVLTGSVAPRRFRADAAAHAND